MKKFPRYSGIGTSIAWMLMSCATALAQAPAGPIPTGQPPEDFDTAMLKALLTPLPPDAPQPSADPRNFEGTWIHDQPLVWLNTQDMYGNKLPYTPLGRRIMERRVKANDVDELPYANAAAECRPPGQQWQYDLNFPFQIYQSKDVIHFLFEEFHGVWKIRLDQAHRATGEREYMGDSVAHWDGNTLVVETINYRQPLWIDHKGNPASKEARFVHRIRRVDYGTPRLEIATTVHDPRMYTAPWSVVRTFRWRPDKMIFKEYNCEQQVGAPGGVSRFGLVPEPPLED